MNCPEGHYSCEGCRYHDYETCVQTGEPVSIFDLMTHQELIDYIKDKVQPMPEWSRRQWGELQQVKAGYLHLEHKLTELQAKKKETEKAF